VVSDTSPLNYLILVGAIDVLPRLFDEVHVPAEVVAELRRSRAPESVKIWAASPPAWLRVSNPSLTVTTFIKLDPGELQAISLAKELGVASILIDERKGRRVAGEHGLFAIGTLTILEMAAQKKWIDLNFAIAALRLTTFHISDELLQAAIARANKTDTH